MTDFITLTMYNISKTMRINVERIVAYWALDHYEHEYTAGGRTIVQTNAHRWVVMETPEDIDIALFPVKIESLKIEQPSVDRELVLEAALTRLSTAEAMTTEGWGFVHPELTARIELARSVLKQFGDTQ